MRQNNINPIADTGPIVTQTTQNEHTLFFPLKGLSRDESIFSNKAKGVFRKKYEPIFKPIINKQLAVNTYYQNDLIAPANTLISIDLLKIFDEFKINFRVNIKSITHEQRDHAFDAALSQLITRKKKFLDSIQPADIPKIQDSAKAFIMATLNNKNIPLFQDHYAEVKGYLEFASDVITSDEKYIGIAAALKEVVENEKKEFHLGEDETGETIIHIFKTAWLSLILAKELGFLSQKDYKTLSIICIGHDGGKALMPREIIYKKSRLTQLESDIMKSHVLFSYILASNNQQNLDFESFAMALHHIKENKRLADSYSIANDTAISFYEYLTDDAKVKFDQVYQYTKPFYRMISIADSFEAISAERVYKKASTIGKTLEIMRKINTEQEYFFEPYLEAFFRFILKKFLPRNLKFNITDEILDTLPSSELADDHRKNEIQQKYQGVIVQPCKSLDDHLQCLIYDTTNRQIEHRVSIPPLVFLDHMYIK